MSDETAGWLRCAICDEEWPEGAFRASGSAYHGREGKRICDACFLERYPRRVVPCSVCGKRMGTRGQSADPTCRPCRARRSAGEDPPTHCRQCHAPIAGLRVMSDGRCYQCYERIWRVRRRVNGKQRVGAWKWAA